MKRVSSSLVIAAALWTLVPAAGASAAIVTVGSPLTASFESVPCTTTNSCTGLNASLPEPGAVIASPVDGLIIRWRITMGAPPNRYKLRVLSPAGGSSYTGAGTSTAETPSGVGLETFATAMAIKAGQVIGLDVEKGAPLGFAEKNGGTVLGWIPALADGSTLAASDSIGGEIAFNADVQPVPTISGIKPASGSFKGGTSVTITGTDFEGAGAVAFGGVPASSFTVDSEGQISAVSPALKPLAKVPVTVTTAAGTATSATLFKGTACVVPNLKGKTLKSARKKLKKKSCKLGKVKGHRTKSARIVKQKPKAGKKLAPGSKVKVTLGEGK